MEKIYKAELPKYDDLVQLFITIDEQTTTYDDLIKIKVLYMKTGIDLSKDWYEYIAKEMYGSNVATILDVLSAYQSYISGMIGIGESLAEKIRIVAYKTHLVDAEGKKLSQGDRSEYAKMDSVSIDGLVRSLKEIQKNVYQKHDLTNRKS